MPRRMVLAIRAKKHSMRLSHEPCLGVKTNSKRLGTVFRYARVSFEMWELWLSRTILRNSMNSRLRCRAATRPWTWPLSKSMPASRLNVPWRLYS